MENLIYNELLFRGFSVSIGDVEHYIKDENGNKEKWIRYEIDFVICRRDTVKELIQVAYI